MCLAGLAMSLTLYEAAFTAIREFEREAFRRSITTLSLVGGFASTLFWPLTHALLSWGSWRSTLVCFATLQLLICLPLHLALPGHNADPRELAGDQPAGAEQASGLLRSPVFWALSLALFAASMFSGAVSAHAAGLLKHQQVSESVMLWSMGLFGPMQVVGRLLDLGWGNRLPLKWTGGLAFAGFPVAMLLLSLCHNGQPWAFAFSCVYGMANGVLTIVSGLAPAEMLGSYPYAQSLGWLSGFGMLARALAPALGALMLTWAGPGFTMIALALVGVVGLLSFEAACRAASKQTA